MDERRLYLGSDEVTRRAFLGRTARTLLGLGTIPFLEGRLSALEKIASPTDAARVASARRVIYLYMSGGMSHLDTFDLKPGQEVQGPTEAISTRVDGLRMSQHFPNLARHADKLAVINSMFSNQGAHAQGRYLLHTSYELRGTIQHPSLGAWLSRLGGRINPTLPGHVAIGGATGTATAGFLESAHAPLPIGDPTQGLAHSELAKGVDEETFARRLDRLERMNRAFREKHDRRDVRSYDEAYREAVRLMRSADLAAFDISQEPEALRDAYGRDPFGQGCLLARRLVEHDVRFVEVVLGGWDTHNENFENLEDRCPILDRSLSALLADLEARGLLEETLVVVGTEFGRTPEIRAERNGRDHHPKAFTCLLAGGGVRGGQVYGKTDERGENVVENRVTVQDFNATIADALGLPLEETIYSPSGRPFTIADKGRPVRELFT